jgi:hypothetical protein
VETSIRHTKLEYERVPRAGSMRRSRISAGRLLSSRLLSAVQDSARVTGIPGADRVSLGAAVHAAADRRGLTLMRVSGSTIRQTRAEPLVGEHSLALDLES